MKGRAKGQWFVDLVLRRNASGLIGYLALRNEAEPPLEIQDGIQEWFDIKSENDVWPVVYRAIPQLLVGGPDDQSQ